MNGCFKGALRLGCFVAIAAVLVLLWWLREPILRTGARWFGRSEALPPVADTSVGAPTPSAVASAQAKIKTLTTKDSVVLTANEVASLIGGGIDWTVRKTFDSLRVELLDGTIDVHARLDTRALPPSALGPLSGIVQPREPLRLGGKLEIERPGIASYSVKEIAVRGIQFPAPTVSSILRQLTGDSGGAIPLTVDPAIAEVVVHPTGVVLYRKARSRR